MKEINRIEIAIIYARLKFHNKMLFKCTIINISLWYLIEIKETSHETTLSKFIASSLRIIIPQRITRKHIFAIHIHSKLYIVYICTCLFVPSVPKVCDIICCVFLFYNEVNSSQRRRQTNKHQTLHKSRQVGVCVCVCRFSLMSSFETRTIYNVNAMRRIDARRCTSQS